MNELTDNGFKQRERLTISRQDADACALDQQKKVTDIAAFKKSRRKTLIIAIVILAVIVIAVVTNLK